MFKYLLDHDTKSNAIIIDCDTIYTTDDVIFFSSVLPDGDYINHLMVPVENVLYVKLNQEEIEYKQQLDIEGLPN